MKKIALSVLLALAMIPAASYAQVAIRIGPPAPVVENPGPPPRAGFVWIGGYHRWDGDHYVWVHGHWGRPPRAGAVWIPAHWAHRHGRWIMIEGHWRY